jgi:uncharacterized protein
MLRGYGVIPEILCVVHSGNVNYPLQVYQYFKELGAPYITFIPLVEPDSAEPDGISDRSVPATSFGKFLTDIFDEWLERDIGKIKVQIFEEAISTAFKQEHTLCIFKEVCGRVPVVEHDGGFYSCDHFVDRDHHLGNIQDTPLVDLLESPEQRAFGKAKKDRLPEYCKQCEVKAMCNGGCPKNRIISAPDGEPGLNYLCPGYKQFFTHCKPFVAEIARLWQVDR